MSNAAEVIQTAIKRLTQIRGTLGYVMLGEDPGQLYIRCESDVDDDGNTFSYGLSVAGVDSDEEINEAIIALRRTIDAQLAILQGQLTLASRGHGEATISLDLARAILGEDI